MSSRPRISHWVLHPRTPLNSALSLGELQLWERSLPDPSTPPPLPNRSGRITPTLSGSLTRMALRGVEEIEDRQCLCLCSDLRLTYLNQGCYSSWTAYRWSLSRRIKGTGVHFGICSSDNYNATVHINNQYPSFLRNDMNLMDNVYNVCR